MALQNYYGDEAKISEGCFDCNICLDSANEPIVTLCGHLYCWGCIYKWLHVQSASLGSDEHPQCPVCKADICHTAMVPLYARGHRHTQSEPEPYSKLSSRLGMWVPPRPSVVALRPRSGGQQLPYRNPYQSQQRYSQQAAVAHVSGGDQSYRAMASSTPRLRRLEIQADKSLNRVSIFLFCCLLLCLVVF